MPLIDTPFKRIAVDLIGPIHPPSEQGHRYILTLVDYATRYPDAVPLKSISTEAVAEALVDMYSRLGVPEEVLSNLGAQFVSECMQEVSRLLSIKQLSTTPYHLMCNSLVEKFNGSLRSMLKKLCSEQPRQWHRYINALLFAYREVPQGSTRVVVWSYRSWSDDDFEAVMNRRGGRPRGENQLRVCIRSSQEARGYREVGAGRAEEVSS